MYQVVEITDETVVLWDGVSKDPDTRKKNTMELGIGFHPFRVGQTVELVVRLAEGGDVPLTEEDLSYGD